ncbi:hypothetical protein MO867_06590 [Microbulbifer sp. OS29]|uniref:Uncharacterized protein n=1 Tax=Microbulbifer okhotskensis TaxID=2926617 RepID=A0A9X2J726_9GAMM|nr:hypothetical protein [Microbulbifer okhotskensis]MCO1334006.1 hypothetical protein [Microbulbifer okhotskensis]
MATASFDKAFVVTNPEDIARIEEDFRSDNFPEIEVKDRDIDAESREGVQRLLQKFSFL